MKYKYLHFVHTGIYFVNLPFLAHLSTMCSRGAFVVMQCLLCVVNILPYGHSRGNISCSVDLKFDQNVFLDKILDEFEFGSPGVIN